MLAEAELREAQQEADKLNAAAEAATDTQDTSKSDKIIKDKITAGDLMKMKRLERKLAKE